MSNVGCYERQFTGAVHLQWYGVTNDEDITTTCPNCLTNAFAAAAKVGNNHVDTDGLRIQIDANVAPQAHQRLTCSAPFTGLPQNSNYSNLPGSIIFSHGYSVQIDQEQVEFDHCIVLTSGNSNNINLNPSGAGTAAQQQRAVITNYANMVTNGDTGILCQNAEQAYIHDVTVIGFDTGIAADNCSRFRLDGANIDANVGVFTDNGGSPAYLADFSVEPFLARNVNNKNTNYQITGIADNGSGLCRVTIGSSNVADGDTVFVLAASPHQTDYADMGVVSCHGRYKVQAVSGDPTKWDLVGSHYNTGNFLTTNGTGACGSSWVKNAHVLNYCLTTATDTIGVRPGETVTSSDGGVFAGQGTVTILDVSKYPKNGQYKIVVDKLTQDSQPASAGYTLSFSNLGSYNTATKYSYLYLYPTARIYAGSSIGGAATNGNAACLQGGGPEDTSAGGIIAHNVFCFGHLWQYHFDATDPLDCLGCGMDSDPDLADDQQIGLYYGSGLGEGLPGTGKAEFIGSVTGGGNIIVDSSGGGPCNAVSGTAVAPNMNGRLAVELYDGCINLTGVSSAEQNDVLIGGSVNTGSSLLGSYFSGALYYEKPAGQTINTAGDSFASGEGNGVRQCNPSYSTGCVQYSMNSSGAWRLLDSSQVPVQEFKDTAHLHLNNTYEDGIAANTIPPALTTGINVVSSCVHTGCSSDGVTLPASTNLLDVPTTAPGWSSCTGSAKCGAAGGITVVNTRPNSILVLPTSGSGDTVNNGTSYALAGHAAKTFYPVSGVGYISN